MGRHTEETLKTIEALLRLPGIDARAWLTEGTELASVDELGEQLLTQVMQISDEDLRAEMGRKLIEHLGREVAIALLLDLTEERRQHLRTVE